MKLFLLHKPTSSLNYAISKIAHESNSLSVWKYIYSSDLTMQ